MKGQCGNETFRGRDCRVLQHMEEMPQEESKVPWNPPHPRKQSHPSPPHHLGRGQHQDDEPHLTAVLPPVLRANQAADAHVPLQ